MYVVRTKDIQINEQEKLQLNRSLLVILLHFAMKKLTTLSLNIELDEELWLMIYIFIIKAQKLHLIMLYSKTISGVLPFLDLIKDNPNLSEIYIKVSNAPTWDDAGLLEIKDSIVQ